MLRKLGGYTVIFVCSFCFFTFLFHTIVGAETQSGVQLRHTPIPVPTLVPTTKLRRNPTPTRILTTPSQTTTSPTPTPPPAGGPQVLALALPITTATPTLIVTPTVTPKPTVQPTATVVQPTPTAVPATPTPTPPAGGPTFPPTTDIDTLFSRYSDMYHADKSTLQNIARCESGFNSQAVNGPYLGMFQFASQTWISNRTRMGLDTNPDLRTSAEEAIKTAAFMIGNGGVNAWAGCL